MFGIYCGNPCCDLKEKYEDAEVDIIYPDEKDVMTIGIIDSCRRLS